MGKIFRYECRRLLWNKFFIGLAVVLLLYGAFVLHAVTILGVAHTAPFSPWSFGDYLSRMMPLLWLGMLFFLTFYTSPQARRASDDALFARFLALPQVEAADTLLLYHGMGGEPDTARLLPALWARGKAVCLPRCLPGRGLEARLVRPDSALIPHPYGMLEPGEDCPLVGKDAIGLVLVPGLAFDPSGGRLGQGAGFYDRWLADYAGCTAALCRTALLLPQVPRAPHDRGVELVLTEHGLYRADAQRSGAQRPRSSPDGGPHSSILPET